MRKQVIGVLLFLLPALIYGQSEAETKLRPKDKRKARPTYYRIEAGFNNSNFRDFGTSPLVYSGSASVMSIARLKRSAKVDSEFGFFFSGGSYTNTTNDHESTSEVQTGSVFYSKHYQIPEVLSDKWDLKVGGLINTTGNFRVNQALGNNANGKEIIATVFASAKLSRDITRTETKKRKFLFIRYTLPKRKRTLTYQLNVGLMNNTYRNGYAYIDQSDIVNDPQVFGNYEFKAFSGYRMGSELTYTAYWDNNNAFQWAYKWDAYKTGGSLDKFEMASHVISFSFLFNTK